MRRHCLTGLQWVLLEKFQKGQFFWPFSFLALCTGNFLEEIGAASGGSFFFHWTGQDYCKTHSVKLGIVGSGKDLSITWISQAGWWLQKESPTIPAGSLLADWNSFLSSCSDFFSVLLWDAVVILWIYSLPLLWYFITLKKWQLQYLTWIGVFCVPALCFTPQKGESGSEAVLDVSNNFQRVKSEYY